MFAPMQCAVFLAMLVACSGGAGGGSTGHGPGPAPGRADAGVPAAAAPVTVRECDELIAHAVALAGAARGSGSAAATAAELDGVAATLRAELGVRCAAVPRAALACAMATSALADLAACER